MTWTKVTVIVIESLKNYIITIWSVDSTTMTSEKKAVFCLFLWQKKVDFVYKRCNNKYLKLIKGVILWIIDM